MSSEEQPQIIELGTIPTEQVNYWLDLGIRLTESSARFVAAVSLCDGRLIPLEGRRLKKDEQLYVSVNLGPSIQSPQNLKVLLLDLYTKDQGVYKHIGYYDIEIDGQNASTCIELHSNFNPVNNPGYKKPDMWIDPAALFILRSHRRLGLASLLGALSICILFKSGVKTLNLEGTRPETQSLLSDIRYPPRVDYSGLRIESLLKIHKTSEIINKFVDG